MPAEKLASVDMLTFSPALPGVWPGEEKNSPHGGCLP